MKLNLLPTTVSKGRQARTAWVFFFILIVASTLGALGVSIQSAKDVARQKERLEVAKKSAEEANRISKEADTILSETSTVSLLKNTALAKAMIAHNTVYPDAYDSIQKYFPKFFRAISQVATSIDDKTSSVTVTGVIGSYQDYADLMLALLRNPDVVTVSRSGYVSIDPIVPNVTQTDQIGRPRRANDQPVPDDPLERLAYFQAQPKPSGYLGVGNYGSGTQVARGAMPSESLITITMIINKDLRTPIPRQTLTGGGGGAGGGASTAFGPPGGIGGFGGAAGFGGGGSASAGPGGRSGGAGAAAGGKGQGLDD